MMEKERKAVTSNYMDEEIELKEDMEDYEDGGGSLVESELDSNNVARVAAKDEVDLVISKFFVLLKFVTDFYYTLALHQNLFLQ
jgi:hypothetical protein